MWRHEVVMPLICGRVCLCLIVAAFNNGFFSFFGWGGVRLIGTSATIWRILPAPDDGWWWVWSSRWNNWQGKPKLSAETWANAALFTTNPSWPDPGSNPGRRCGKPATNCQSYGTTFGALIREPTVPLKRLVTFTVLYPRRQNCLYTFIVNSCIHIINRGTR
jgi:hypothetical protein